MRGGAGLVLKGSVSIDPLPAPASCTCETPAPAGTPAESSGAPQLSMGCAWWDVGNRRLSDFEGPRPQTVAANPAGGGVARGLLMGRCASLDPGSRDVIFLSRYPRVPHSLSPAKSSQDPPWPRPKRGGLGVGGTRGFPRRSFCARTRRKEFPRGQREPRIGPLLNPVT